MFLNPGFTHDAILHFSPPKDFFARLIRIFFEPMKLRGQAQIDDNLGVNTMFSSKNNI